MFIASYLRENGCEVKITNRLCGDSLVEDLWGFQPDIVGVTGTTQAAPWTYECADYCRSEGTYVVIGGIHATALPNEALEHADCVITGEGEQTMLEACKVKPNGIIKGTPINLDLLPMPAYDLVDMKYYCAQTEGIAAFNRRDSKVGFVLTSRGCPYRCIYCYNAFRDAPIRYANPQKVVDEIKTLKERYGLDTICFLEDNFFMNKPRVYEICKLIKPLNLIWSANGRADNMDPELLEVAHDAGCRQVAFGFESGSQRILDILQKDITVEDSKHAIQLCDEAGIIVSGSFMLGNPTESVEDIQLTMQFMRENNIDGGFGVCVTLPFPGTKLWSWCLETGRILGRVDWRKFSYMNQPIRVNDLDMGEFRRLVNEAGRLGAYLFYARRGSRMQKVA